VLVTPRRLKLLRLDDDLPSGLPETLPLHFIEQMDRTQFQELGNGNGSSSIAGTGLSRLIVPAASSFVRAFAR
jgi:hypothetical protein